MTSIKKRLLTCVSCTPSRPTTWIWLVGDTLHAPHTGDEGWGDLLGGFDLVLEGGDGADERKAFNRWAVEAGQLYIHASAQYNYAYVQTVVPGQSACFECSFGDLPATHRGPVPVVGPATGVAGSVAASEALGILMGMPPSLDSKTFFYDGWENCATQLSNHRSPDCAVCSDSAVARMEGIRTAR